MRASGLLVLGFLLALPAAAQPIEAGPAYFQPLPDGPSAPEEPPMRSGVYVGLRGSYAFNANAATTWTASATPTQLRASYASGAGGSVFIGTRLPLNLRLELEGLYRWQPLSTLSLGGTRVAAGGNSKLAAPMLNLFWDVPVPDELSLQPFVGMGVGAAYLQTDAAGSGNSYLHQNRWDLAWSFMGGMALPLDEDSRLTAMYRFLQVRDVPHRCATSGTVLGACLENSVNSSAVDLGYELDL